MQQAPSAATPFPTSDLLHVGGMAGDRSVEQAALFSGLVGLLCMLALCGVFLDAGLVVNLANDSDVVGLPLALLLLVTVGGYGMLAFYGFRLRTLWRKRNQPVVRHRRHDPARLALSDLRKIRWYSAATMLAVLTVYLLPRKTPQFEAESRWWSSPAAIQWMVMIWMIVGSAVILAARRAAWNIAAAAGNLSGPDDVRAFEVLTGGSDGGTPSDMQAASSAEMVQAIPVAGVFKPTPIAAAGMIPPAGTSAQTLPLQAAAATPTGTAAAVERITAAESINSRRDWETVLLTLLVLLLLLFVSFVDQSRSLRATIINPRMVFEVYDQYKANPSGLMTRPWTARTTRNLAEPKTAHGVAAALLLLGNQFAVVVASGGVLWIALCLMSGPRWHKPATLLLALLTAAILSNSFILSYFGSHGIDTVIVDRNLRPLGMFASAAEMAILPVVLVVLLTRPSVRVLFEQRVRKAAKSANRL